MNSNNDNDLFKKMAVDVADFYGIATVDCWDNLPEPFRLLIRQIEYKSLIVPLVLSDRKTRGLTWQQLSIKYRISVQTVRTILAKVPKHALKNNVTTPGKSKSE